LTFQPVPTLALKRITWDKGANSGFEPRSKLRDEG
jgi:hypothetical protein